MSLKFLLLKYVPQSINLILYAHHNIFLIFQLHSTIIISATFNNNNNYMSRPPATRLILNNVGKFIYYKNSLSPLSVKHWGQIYLEECTVF